MPKEQDRKQRVIAYASRSTTTAEQHYPQIDLEAASLDFACQRFRIFIMDGPPFKAITDHKPLVPIFNGNRHGSTRTERIKMRLQGF